MVLLLCRGPALPVRCHPAFPAQSVRPPRPWCSQNSKMCVPCLFPGPMVIPETLGRPCTPPKSCRDEPPPPKHTCCYLAVMGVAKRTRKFAQMKRVIGKSWILRISHIRSSTQVSETPDCMSAPSSPMRRRRRTQQLTSHRQKNQIKGEVEAKKKAEAEQARREIPQAPSSLFFMANEALGPPYRVLIDTNFLSHTVHVKLDLQQGLMDLLYAKATPIITSCVVSWRCAPGPRIFFFFMADTGTDG